MANSNVNGTGNGEEIATSPPLNTSQPVATSPPVAPLAPTVPPLKPNNNGNKGKGNNNGSNMKGFSNFSGNQNWNTTASSLPSAAALAAYNKQPNVNVNVNSKMVKLPADMKFSFKQAVGSTNTEGKLTIYLSEAEKLPLGWGMPGFPGWSGSIPQTPSFGFGSGSMGDWWKKVELPTFTFHGKPVSGLLMNWLSHLPNGEDIANMLTKFKNNLEGLPTSLRLGLPAFIGLLGMNFTFLTSFRRLGILITLSQWFDNQPVQAIKDISADLKKFENSAKECVKRTIALANTLQSSAGEFAKKNVKRSKDGLIDDIDTLNEIKEELNTRLKSVLSGNTNLAPGAASSTSLDSLLDNLCNAYDALADDQIRKVTAQNAADFRLIVTNFKQMINLPQDILNTVKDIPNEDAKLYFATLLEKGKAARSLLAQTGYDISRLASNVRSGITRRVSGVRNSLFSKNGAKNATKKNGNNRSWWRKGVNKIKGAYGTIKNRIFKQKNPVPTVNQNILGNNSMVTRKNRRHH